MVGYVLKEQKSGAPRELSGDGGTECIAAAQATVREQSGELEAWITQIGLKLLKIVLSTGLSLTG